MLVVFLAFILILAMILVKIFIYLKENIMLLGSGNEKVIAILLFLIIFNIIIVIGVVVFNSYMNNYSLIGNIGITGDEGPPGEQGPVQCPSQDKLNIIRKNRSKNNTDPNIDDSC
jgi:hypothetical protein